MQLKQLRISELRKGDWEKKHLKLSDVSKVVDESCEIFGPDGKRAAMLVRNCVSQENLRTAWFHLKDYNPSTSNRGTASGLTALRKRRDGTLSKTHIGKTVNSGVMGFYDRYPRIPFCRKCAFNQQHPEKFASMLPLFRDVSNMFYSFWPEKWAVNKTHIDKTHADFVIPETVFTTVTVNKNYQTACHRDPRNLENSISTMLVIHDGRIEGGELILPEYDVALRFRSGDLVWFENTKMLHANAPIVKLSSTAQRCSLVFYYRKDMCKCGSHAEELERAKNRKLGTKMYDEGESDVHT